MGINPTYKIMERQRLYGSNAIEENQDMSTKKELITAMNNFFENYACPSCGGHRMRGNIIVEIAEIEFFREILKKGFFGKKIVTEKFKTVWRVQHTYLKPSGFLSYAGRIWCQSCGWEEKGAKGIRWVSINDIRNGNF